ncbi:PHP domain-containing protein [Candidatus Bathyarchaeota archaeon]|nr:MAG: PHP domain-containing protein [Candidatus Bathyarchaeota archaeon]
MHAPKILRCLALLLKVDLHVHTVYSDGRGTVEEVLRVARAKDLDGLAITDHATLDGYFEAKSYESGLFILPGYEVPTDAGHVLVLGLEMLPPERGFMRYEELIKWARDNGGFTVLAHPAVGRAKWDKWVRCKPDAVEALNASYPFSRYFVRKGLKIASRLSVPAVGGSDAHYPRCVGDAYTIVDVGDLSFPLKALKNGIVGFDGRLSPLLARLRIGVGYMLSALI